MDRFDAVKCQIELRSRKIPSGKILYSISIHSETADIRPGKQTVCDIENGPVEIVDLH